MSPPKPSITKITLAEVTNSALMVALFDHFNGGSIYFTPVLDGGNPIENGFTSGEDSFLIEPVSSDEAWQVNFRRTANDRGLVMVDPGNGITDSGGPAAFPVGASVEASGEVDYPWDLSVSHDELFLLEYFDALMIFVVTSTANYLSHSCYVGKIHDPFNSNNPSEGLDGLGILCGKPFLSEASQTEAWASSDSTTQQIRTGTSEWVTSVTAWKSTSGFDSFVGVRPDGVVFRYLGRPLGVLKYFFNFTGTSQAPFALIWDENGVAQYMYCSDKVTPSSQIVPWVDGVDVTPTPPPPPPPPTVLEVQQAAGFDHAYDFDFVGTPTADQGAATAADLTVQGTWTHAAPSVTGTAGSYENLTNFSPGNQLKTGATAVNVARTSDVFYEGIWELPTTPTNNSAFAFVGGFGSQASHSLFGWNSSGYIYLIDIITGSTLINVTGLTAAYLTQPTYIAVWYDYSAGVFRLYYKKAGQPETVVSSVVRPVGLAGNQQLWISGNGVNAFTCKMIVHAFGIKRGALTLTHRNNVYAAAGM